jgi:hypothetical protein
LLGLDPYDLLDQGREEYLIKIALMQKASALRSERTLKELEVGAKLTGYEIAKIMARIL